jgi:endonuclease YncB( thermonuclease family)
MKRVKKYALMAMLSLILPSIVLIACNSQTNTQIKENSSAENLTKELELKISELEKQLEELQDKLSQAKNKSSLDLELISSLQDETESKRKEIDSLKDQVANLTPRPKNWVDCDARGTSSYFCTINGDTGINLLSFSLNPYDTKRDVNWTVSGHPNYDKYFYTTQTTLTWGYSTMTVAKRNELGIVLNVGSQKDKTSTNSYPIRAIPWNVVNVNKFNPDPKFYTLKYYRVENIPEFSNLYIHDTIYKPENIIWDPGFSDQSSSGTIYFERSSISSQIPNEKIESLGMTFVGKSSSTASTSNIIALTKDKYKAYVLDLTTNPVVEAMGTRSNMMYNQKSVVEDVDSIKLTYPSIYQRIVSSNFEFKVYDNLESLPGTSTKITVNTCTDGDTFNNLRFKGIDTPEKKLTGPFYRLGDNEFQDVVGQLATDACKELVVNAGKTAWSRSTENSSYGRAVSYIYTGDKKNYNAQIIARGWATSSIHWSDRDTWRTDEYIQESFLALLHAAYHGKGMFNEQVWKNNALKNRDNSYTNLRYSVTPFNLALIYPQGRSWWTEYCSVGNLNVDACVKSWA